MVHQGYPVFSHSKKRALAVKIQLRLIDKNPQSTTFVVKNKINLFRVERTLRDQPLALAARLHPLEQLRHNLLLRFWPYAFGGQKLPQLLLASPVQGHLAEFRLAGQCQRGTVQIDSDRAFLGGKQMFKRGRNGLINHRRCSGLDSNANGSTGQQQKPSLHKTPLEQNRGNAAQGGMITRSRFQTPLPGAR